MADEGDERAAQVRGALIKAVLAIVVIAVVIAIGTTVLVRALGLNQGTDSGGKAEQIEKSRVGERVAEIETRAMPQRGQAVSRTDDCIEASGIERRHKAFAVSRAARDELPVVVS